MGKGQFLFFFSFVMFLQSSCSKTSRRGARRMTSMHSSIPARNERHMGQVIPVDLDIIQMA